MDFPSKKTVDGDRPGPAGGRLGDTTPISEGIGPKTSASRLDLQIVLQAAGWPACAAIWFLVMGATSLWGQSEIARLFGLVGLFMGGVFGIMAWLVTQLRDRS